MPQLPVFVVKNLPVDGEVVAIFVINGLEFKVATLTDAKNLRKKRGHIIHMFQNMRADCIVELAVSERQFLALEIYHRQVCLQFTSLAALLERFVRLESLLQKDIGSRMRRISGADVKNTGSGRYAAYEMREHHLPLMCRMG